MDADQLALVKHCFRKKAFSEFCVRLLMTKVNQSAMPIVIHIRPPIPSEWPSNLRLMLAGLGQQANPAQTLWIVAQTIAHVDFNMFGNTSVRPRQLLDQYLDKMRIQAKDLVDSFQFPNNEDLSEPAVRSIDDFLAAGRPETVPTPMDHDLSAPWG